MTESQPKDVKKSRGVQGSNRVQETRAFVGSRVEPTSTTPRETPAASRPKKK